MSKISSIFGPKGSAKPSKREIFEALHQKKLDEDAALLGNTKNASLKKLAQGRQGKSSRLGGRPGGVAIGDDEEFIKRPGARRAKLLGS